MTPNPNPRLVPGSPLVSEFSNDPDMRDLIAMFVDEMPEKVATLESLARSRDFESLKRLAHQLKGASGGYGFTPVGAAAGVLEETLKSLSASQDTELATIESQVKGLINLCNRVTK
jgi:HPt (histidine-containing phosphotransfer) domain-containing protein